MNQRIKLQVGELFAGAGGLSLGFILAEHPQINFQPIFAIDNDTHSINSYKYNMKWLVDNVPDELPETPKVFNRNVEKLNTSALLRLFKMNKGELDILIGGPPCQGFSSANRRSKEASKADRNRLINIFLNKLKDFQPKMFLIENVQGVRWTEPTLDMAVEQTQKSLFPDIQVESLNVKDFLIEKAGALGYYIWSDTLDAVNFGVPQHRMRFFMFGVHKDLVINKDDINLTPYLNKLKSPHWVSVFRAISDLPPLENGQMWTGEHYDPSQDEYIQKLRRFMKNGELYDHTTTNHANYVIERYRQIPEGGNWKDIKESMSNYKSVDNTHSNIYRRLSSDKPAITISHYRKSMIIHPSQHRGLSFREACRLQSFPDWFQFQGPNGSKQQQLANAVPPLMAAAVAKAIGDIWIKLRESTATAENNANSLKGLQQ